jgi:hypothetical protein
MCDSDAGYTQIDTATAQAIRRSTRTSNALATKHSRLNLLQLQDINEDARLAVGVFLRHLDTPLILEREGLSSIAP